MKKLTLLLLILFITNTVYAFSIDFSPAKESYSSGETFQSEILISGVLEEELNTGNIKLVCSEESVGIAPILFKIQENNYYTYFNLNLVPENENCSLILQDVVYYESGLLKQGDFNYNLQFIQDNSSKLYINPAGIRIHNILDENEFTFYVTNNGESSLDVSLSSSASFIDISESIISVSENQSSSFDIYISPLLIEETEKEDLILDYGYGQFVVPIWLFYEEEVIDPPTNNSPITPPEALLDFQMDVDEIDITLNKTQDISGYVTIVNQGYALNFINFSLTGNLGEVIDLHAEQLNFLGMNESYREYIYVNQRRNANSGEYSGTLLVDYVYGSIEYPISVLILDDNNEINNTNQSNNNTNGTNNGNQNNGGISVWWYVLIFFVILLLVFYLLYRNKTKKMKTNSFQRNLS